MTSTRKALRHAIRDLLVDADTAAGTRVETNRSSRVWNGQLPALVIYTQSDPAETFETSPLSYRRDLRIAVECWTSKVDADEEDDRLDDLVDEVEAAILPQIPALVEAVDGLLGASGYEGVEAGFDSQGERILAGARVTFRIAYVTLPDYTPEGGLAPFTLAHVEHDVPSETGDDPDAVDDVVLDQ